MNKILFVLLFFVFACGSHKTTQKPDEKSTTLEQEIARVEPQIVWACDMPIESPYRGLACSGDAMSMTGHVMLYGHMGNFDSVIKSISIDGRPWRSPVHVNNQASDSFSRDAFIGLIESTTASGNKEPLQRVWDYVQSTGKLCPDAGDGRCNLTQSVSILARDALGISVSSAERLEDFVTVNAEAATVPISYQTYLVSRKMGLKAMQNKLTPEYAHAISVLLARFPKNLFYRTVNEMAHKGNFEPIVAELTKCLAQWKTPGKEWTWSAAGPCIEDSQGHELVALGKFLLNSPVSLGLEE